MKIQTIQTFAVRFYTDKKININKIAEILGKTFGVRVDVIVVDYDLTDEDES